MKCDFCNKNDWDFQIVIKSVLFNNKSKVHKYLICLDCFSKNKIGKLALKNNIKWASE